MGKRVAILISDGVSLRNFVYSDFVKVGLANDWNFTFINQSSIDFKQFNLNYVDLKERPKSKSDLLKRARKHIELQNFEKRYQDDIYKSYKFKSRTHSIKSFVKNAYVRFCEVLYSGKNIETLRTKIIDSERHSALYKSATTVLKSLKPDLLFVTSQRSLKSIAPILAAQDLNISTLAFIYSWDNVPKATLVVEPDYYVVWSDYMKNELLKYYSYIEKSQILVTGTPQFEMHKDESLVQLKNEFYKAHQLEVDREYICFSGDDITTSPHDAQYLEDVAKAVMQLNTQGYNLGIIFRRCPVDFSDRYDAVLKHYSEIIRPLAPIWNSEGTLWNTVVPQREDQALLLNTVKHTKLVINLGSSMVFDAVIHKTPCAYINYNPKHTLLKKDVHKVYNYVHFRSMPSKDAVLWLNSEEDISDKIKHVIDKKNNTLTHTEDWFKRINKHPFDKASERIWDTFETIKT